MIKMIRYFIEYLLVCLWLRFTKFLGLKQATNLASKIFQFIGMKLKVTKTARQNLRMIFPNFKATKIEQILLEIWDNFGRMSAETSILVTMNQKEFDRHINIIGLEHLNKIKKTGAIFFTAHLANWEILGKVLAPYDIKFHAIYRAANNKLVDKIINDIRHSIDVELIPKGKNGAKQIISALQNNAKLLMLVDQKMNDGIKVPFLGKDAMTAPAIASLALKYSTPLIPIQVIRKKNSHFDIIIHPELQYQNKNIDAIMRQINDKIGDWVKENPGQWFWLHKRWI